jgi:hypothetical protein
MISFALYGIKFFHQRSIAPLLTSNCILITLLYFEVQR